MQNAFDDVLSTPPRSAASRRLRDAFRIAFLLRVPEERMRSGWGEILAAAVLALLIPTGAGIIAWGGGGRLDLEGIPQAVFMLPLALLAAAAVARILARHDAVPLVLLATLLAWVVIDGLVVIAWSLLREEIPGAELARLEEVFFLLPLLWFALAIARFSASLATARSPRLALLPIACVALLALPVAYLHPERSLWVKDWARDENRPARAQALSRSAAGEDAFYRQPGLLARELAAIRPGRKGVVDLYFVGMAGYGNQDVFMREVDSVAAIMRERFDAEGHIVKLVNNAGTALTQPIASTTSLRAALKRVAESMDVEEDVLLLFLTSHGSADHRFALELWPLAFHPLTPAKLRELLDDSGIRNRVVIVSACYSGGFVEALKAEHTLVITAAAADRNSFGCGNENEWTYFGKAYFDEALRTTHSFTKAFEIARPVIERREKEQGFDPSQPQLASGAAIRGPLERLERQLDELAPVASLR